MALKKKKKREPMTPKEFEEYARIRREQKEIYETMTDPYWSSRFSAQVCR